jgi:hypothetical protein
VIFDYTYLDESGVRRHSYGSGGYEGAVIGVGRKVSWVIESYVSGKPGTGVVLQDSHWEWINQTTREAEYGSCSSYHTYS